MKRCVTCSLGAIVLASAVSLLIHPLSAQSRATATNVPVIPHQAIANFFKHPPGIYTGENMGIATSSKGTIYVSKFGAAGRLPKEFGLANSIDCRNENELLIGEMTNWRVQKVTLKR